MIAWLDVAGFVIVGSAATAWLGVAVGVFPGLHCVAVQGARWPEGDTEARRRFCFKTCAGTQLLVQGVLVAITLAIFVPFTRKPGFLPYGWLALAVLLGPRLLLLADALRCRIVLDRLPWRFNPAYVADDSLRSAAAGR